MFPFSGSRISELEDIVKSLEERIIADKGFARQEIRIMKDSYEEKIFELNQQLITAAKEEEYTKREHEQEIELLNKKHVFAIENIESEENNKLSKDVIRLEKALAVSTTNIEHMQKAVNLTADIFDVKDLVNKIVLKLPTVNITGGISSPASINV